MDKDKTQKIQVEYLPKGVEHPKFEQRESGLLHTAYQDEVALYSCIRDGNLSALQNSMSRYFNDRLVVGRMSNDSIRQTRYLAVACITLATRYAIEGGLDEMDAYNFSDECILRIDRIDSAEDILLFLTRKATEITYLVNQQKQILAYPSYVRRAIKYVDVHLHERLTVSSVAAEIGVSTNYFSAIFAKSVGMGFSHYVIRKKLEASKELLDGKHEYSAIGYYFGFCSQSHYISCFKKEFGLTPRQYMDKAMLPPKAV